MNRMQLGAEIPKSQVLGWIFHSNNKLFIAQDSMFQRSVESPLLAVRRLGPPKRSQFVDGIQYSVNGRNFNVNILFLSI